jgi:hypothetical protein
MASTESPDMQFAEGGHLIVVSNRLPITINKDANGEYHFKMSSGGLVSALSGFKKSLNFTWIGWPGFFIPFKDRPLVDKRLKEEYSCQAVYLDDDVERVTYDTVQDLAQNPYKLIVHQLTTFQARLFQPSDLLLDDDLKGRRANEECRCRTLTF